MASSDRLIEVFNEAKTITAGAKRDEFLTEACRGETGLKEQVLSLLHAQERTGGFMQAPPPMSPEVEAELARLKPESPGDRIGPYRLMEQIGEGGFGTVWVADQEKPVRRRVALKIIKLGMDTKDVIARFEQERQALAMMDHPHIAKVLDAGATEWGRPYFVMELVRGIKITDYCDQANLPTAERLALFMQVCSAVQHAHQQGIIHRDLKPSNILVTLHDGVPVPKVIDFGVAKATQQQRLTDLTIYTQFQQMIGTPLYMSPEQAEMSGLEMDTRSDIYSLGVLLYELLTGRTPFDPQELMQKGLDEIRRVIREEEPRTPSMFLQTMPQERRATVAHHRQSDPAKLTNLLRGDLDWIVMKALEKDRRRRYASATAFAEDIQRHLTNKPVVACPPSAAYLLKKHVLRNKAAYVSTGIAGCAIVVALLIGMQFPAVQNAGGIGRSMASQTPAPTPRPLRLVSGVVTAEETGAPLSNALVRVAAPSTDMRDVVEEIDDVHEGRTDAEGRFRIQVPHAETLALDVLAPGYETVSGTHMRGSRFELEDLPFPADDVPELSVKLAPALYVAGVVVDEAGRPFPGADVEATYVGESFTAYVKNDVTDAEGRFEIFDYFTETYNNSKGRLRFEHDEMVRSQVEDIYALDDTARKNLRIVIRRGHQISGTVLSAGGRPAAKTLIEAVPVDPMAQYKQGFTDEDGRYVLPGLPDGEIAVRVHSFSLEQKARATVALKGADAEVNLRLEPVVMKNPLALITLLGMKVADVTPELKAAYDLSEKTQGVVIVNPGENHERLGIGELEEGEYFWIVGNKQIANLREMVDEILRINELEKPDGWITEGYRGSIRVVYSNLHRSNTQYLELTPEDAESLKKLALQLKTADSK